MAKSSSSKCGLIAVAYLPHGSMILNPNRDDLPDGVKSVHSTCMKISQQLADLSPDLIILWTPHGLSLKQAVNIYVSNANAAGNAEWNNEWLDYSVEVELDGEASLSLYSYLQKEKHHLPRVEAMLAFHGLSTPLRWGEVVPLYFALHQMASTQTNSYYLQHVSVKKRPKVVIIAQPNLGHTVDERKSYRQQRVAPLVQLGRAIRSWCNSSSRRIILIISAVPSHTNPWSSDLPTIYQPDPRTFSIFPQSGREQSKLFDRAINDWLTGKRSNIDENLFYLDPKLLMDEAGKHEEDAITCCYEGSLTMQGIMEGEYIQNMVSNPSGPVNSSAKWLLTDFISCRPTYFAITVALYVKNETATDV